MVAWIRSNDAGRVDHHVLRRNGLKVLSEVTNVLHHCEIGGLCIDAVLREELWVGRDGRNGRDNQEKVSIG
jgi:hypothetical protein